MSLGNWEVKKVKKSEELTIQILSYGVTWINVNREREREREKGKSEYQF